MSATCGHHDNMLEKSEFRWVFGICFSVLAGIILFMLSTFANSASVNAIDEKVEYRDSQAERRAQRLEMKMEKVNEKLDELNKYLRGGATGARYR